MRHVLRRAVQGLLRGYQLTLSALLGRRCRFFPSCSEYTRQAVAAHGVRRGLTLGLWRVCRCGPGGGSGFDPVPPVWHNALPARVGDYVCEKPQRKDTP